MTVHKNAPTTKKLGGCTGKGWMPGKSGNPSGRPKNKLISEAYRKMLECEVPNDPQGRTYAELIADRMVAEAVKGRNKVNAASEIADRTEGKPKQTHDVNVSVIDELAQRMEKARKRVKQ
jgi:Family of unknown function (DUF5681)